MFDFRRKLLQEFHEFGAFNLLICKSGNITAGLCKTLHEIRFYRIGNDDKHNRHSLGQRLQDARCRVCALP